jgi:hypothetical protein
VVEIPIPRRLSSDSSDGIPGTIDDPAHRLLIRIYAVGWLAVPGYEMSRHPVRSGSWVMKIIKQGSRQTHESNPDKHLRV